MDARNRWLTPEGLFLIGAGSALVLALSAAVERGWLAAAGCLLGVAVAACGRMMLESARGWLALAMGAAVLGFGAHGVLLALGRPEDQALGLSIGLAIAFGWRARTMALEGEDG
ncbi:MAG: hypothetical protein ACR2J8_08435 [Thermomicrobiales bacterium]